MFLSYAVLLQHVGFRGDLDNVSNSAQISQDNSETFQYEVECYQTKWSELLFILIFKPGSAAVLFQVSLKYYSFNKYLELLL